MRKEPWAEMYRIIAVRSLCIARGPVAVKGSGNGYGKMDVVTAKSTECIVILSWSAPDSKEADSTHLKLTLFHMFGIPEYHSIVRLKLRRSFAVF